MTIRSLDELSAAARKAADEALDAALAAAPARLRGSLRDDLTAHLCDHLDADATAADVQQIAASLAPEGGEAGSWLDRAGAGFVPKGMLGRIAATWWNPADERLLLPRAVGWGWDLNLGAVAVRLGLIEPDAESVPFTSTGDSAFRLAATLPVALAGATALHYLVRGRSLPDPLPAHWTATGRADRWTSRRRAAATDLTIAAAGAGLAAWAATTDRPGPTRAGALTAATMATSLGVGVTGLRTLGDRLNPLATPAMLASSMVAVGVVLVGLARAGRAAEIARDLPRER